MQKYHDQESKLQRRSREPWARKYIQPVLCLTDLQGQNKADKISQGVSPPRGLSFVQTVQENKLSVPSFIREKQRLGEEGKLNFATFLFAFMKIHKAIWAFWVNIGLCCQSLFRECFSDNLITTTEDLTISTLVKCGKKEIRILLKNKEIRILLRKNKKKNQFKEAQCVAYSDQINKLLSQPLG